MSVAILTHVSFQHPRAGCRNDPGVSIWVRSARSLPLRVPSIHLADKH